MEAIGKVAGVASETLVKSMHALDNELIESPAGRGVIAVRAALRVIGMPYSWGGGGPSEPSFGTGWGAGTKGFDCSGLTE